MSAAIKKLAGNALYYDHTTTCCYHDHGIVVVKPNFKKTVSAFSLNKGGGGHKEIASPANIPTNPPLNKGAIDTESS